MCTGDPHTHTHTHTHTHPNGSQTHDLSSAQDYNVACQFISLFVPSGLGPPFLIDRGTCVFINHIMAVL